VEIRETITEVTIPVYVEEEVAPVSKPRLFGGIADDVLLGYGVPAEWLGDVRNANEDTILDLSDHLPGEAAEALLNLATGTPPTVKEPVAADIDPFEHPDAQRRFRVMHDVEELARALDYPWEKWLVFLHPAQRQLVERDFSGPARVSGSAGTGKTIVALHRAVHLARSNPDARVLLTTFSDTLANALRTKLRRLISSEPRLGERIEVEAMNAIGRRLYESNFERLEIASRDVISQVMEHKSGDSESHSFSLRFLTAEWEQVVDAWQLDSWEKYRDVPRLGRRTRLPESRRVVLWSIFERVRAELKARNLVTFPDIYGRLASKYAESGNAPFGFIVVDEAQDVSVAQLRFLAALSADRPNSLFFSGDLGQRIFQQPFSWRGLGVDIRGRSSRLRINYRTSHQIRMQADRLLGPELSDVDGNVEERKGTISVFNGPAPIIMEFDAPEDEIQAVGQWIGEMTTEGTIPSEIGVFVRSDAELERAQSAVEQAGLPFKVLDDDVDTFTGRVSISTMHRAKGLEFRVVIVMACDDEVIPLQDRIETIADESDLEEVYNTERHLLYVACTRARDHLLVTGVTPISEFVDDLGT
jgi:superfamily I DNA/RNA helicase